MIILRFLCILLYTINIQLIFKGLSIGMEQSKSKKEIENEINKLREVIRKHNYQYYVLDEPVISDYEYDKLLKRLITLEQKYPGFLSPDSPTQRVGAQPLEEFKTAKRLVPMLSLSNAFSEKEILDFD